MATPYHNNIERDLDQFLALARGGWSGGLVPALEGLLLVLAEAIDYEGDRMVDRKVFDGTNTVLTPEQPYFQDCAED